MHNATLYTIDAVTGKYAQLGKESWLGTQELLAFDGDLYALWGDGIYRINTKDGSYKRIDGSGNWGGTTYLAGMM